MAVETPASQKLNSDQQRGAVNTQQRFDAFLDAQQQLRAFRGSMVLGKAKGKEYLLRSYYDDNGIRRQTSLGRRSAETERMKAAFDRGRARADDRLASTRAALERQAAVNRALLMGRLSSSRSLRSNTFPSWMQNGTRPASSCPASWRAAAATYLRLMFSLGAHPCPGSLSYVGGLSQLLDLCLQVRTSLRRPL